MFVMSCHPASTAVSFQEAQALSPLLKNGKPSSVNSSIYTKFPVVTEILRRSLELACANNDAFSTRFGVDANQSFQRQVSSPPLTQAFQLSDADVGASLEDPLVAEQIANFYKTGFAFDDAQWLRVLLIRTIDGSSLLVLRAPHLIYDAASVRAFITETWGYYERLTKGEAVTPIPARFSLQDYAASQQAWAASADFQHQFNGLLKHAQQGLEKLSQQRGHAPHQSLPSRPGSFRLVKLPQTTQAQIAHLATQLKVSVSLVLMAATIVFLSHLSAQRHFCFRMPFSGRIANGTEKIIGFLSNDLPVFVNIREGDTFLQLVRKLQQESMSVMRYGAIPCHLLTERLRESHAVTPFNDYLINIIPAVEHFGHNEAMHAKAYPLPITGKTNSILKVLMYGMESGTTVTLKVGEERDALLDEYLMPDFMNWVTVLAEAPETVLGTVLNPTPPHYWAT